MDEFALIAELFAPLAAGFPGALGLKDDAALIDAVPGTQTVVTMDAMVAGVHFLPTDPPDLIARKLLRVNLSDLAAKGAEPFAVLLAAAFPRGTAEEWLVSFARGLAADLKEYAVHLIGGDTVATPGPLTLSLTALGRVTAGTAVLRSGARPGDDVWVTGTIGDGALGLFAARGELPVAPAHGAFLADRYRLPQPRVAAGPRLGAFASAGMDISDGLVQDLGHLARASGVAAFVEAPLVPLSGAARAAIAADHSRLATVLTGGDDYELLFTAPQSVRHKLLVEAEQLFLPITRIGCIAEGAGVTVVDASGRPLALGQGGWRHF